MPKDTGASFFAGARRNFAGHDVAHSAEAKFPFFHFSFHLFSVLGPRAFGHDHKRAEISSGITRANSVRHFLEIERNFGDQDDIRTSSQSAVKGDPASDAA